MNTELKEALEGLEQKLDTSSRKEIKSAIQKFKETLDANLEEKLSAFMHADSENFVELKQDFEKQKEMNTEFKQRLNEMETKMSKVAKSNDGAITEDYAQEFKAQLKENFDAIKLVTKGRNASMEMKAVGIMTSGANLTGDVVKTYQGGVARVPSQMVNFADLVPTIQSSTGSYVIYRETGSEGEISEQNPDGSAKSQIDYDFTEVVFTARYIAGYARFAKQMAQDLPFLTSFLPEALRRDYFKVENAQFYAGIKAGATSSTAAGTTAIERIIQDMGALEANDYLVNGVILNPKDWATIAITKPSDFSLPSVVTFINGNLTINGVPVFKASWVTEDEYVIGDWSMAKKVVVDGLAVEFFEQDQDNVIKNLITARVESRTVLAIDRPDAFILGSIVAPI